MQNNPKSTNPSSKGSKKQQRMILLCLVAVLVIVALFLVVPRVQASIRSSQVESIVDVDFKSKKVTVADPKTIDKEIKDNQAMTVVFSVPSGKSYDQLLSLFKDQNEMQLFSRTLTVYPIIYDVSKIEKEYQIKSTEITAVFFEKGVERNRLVVDDTMNIKTDLVFKLNELPLVKVEGAPDTTEPSTTNSAPAQTEEASQEQDPQHEEKLQTVQ